MTDKEYEIEKKRIRALANRWIRPLGLNWWKLDFEYERFDFHEEIDDKGESTVDKGVIACCSASPEYLEAKIVFYLRKTKSLSDDDLEDTFVHELMHVFVSPMSTKETVKQEEFTATTLARAFIWLRKEVENELEKERKKRRSKVRGVSAKGKRKSVVQPR
jgi:hypothetical protein